MNETPKNPERHIQEFLNDETLSPLQKYAHITVGSSSLISLLHHEIITGLFSGCPGALGYYIRQKTYRSLFKSTGRKLTIGRNVTIRGSKNIELGNNVFIDDNCVLDARGPQGTIYIEDNVLISRNTIIRARNGEVVIGKGADIGCNCLLGTDSRLLISSDVLLAAYTYIVGGGTHKFDDNDTPIINQGAISRGGVVIETGAWLGARTSVLDGVTIGKGTIVGAHSLVNRSLPEMSIAFGNPAKVHRFR